MPPPKEILFTYDFQITHQFREEEKKIVCMQQQNHSLAIFRLTIIYHQFVDSFKCLWMFTIIYFCQRVCVCVCVWMTGIMRIWLKNPQKMFTILWILLHCYIPNGIVCAPSKHQSCARREGKMCLISFSPLNYQLFAFNLPHFLRKENRDSFLSERVSDCDYIQSVMWCPLCTT